MSPVRLEPAAPRSRVKHSTTEQLRSQYFGVNCSVKSIIFYNLIYRKRYNQVPHLTKDTTWESNKNTININKSQEVSPFPAGDRKAAMNRRDCMRNTRQKTQMIHKRSTALERSVQKLIGGLKPVSRRQPHP